MEVKKQFNNNEAVFHIVGRIDTNTAPELEKEVRDVLDKCSSFVFELNEVEYISSAGLRVLLVVQKAVAAKGSLVLKGCNESIKDLLDITGFNTILTVVD